VRHRSFHVRRHVKFGQKGLFTNANNKRKNQSHDRIFEFFREVIQQAFAAGSFQGVLPTPENIKCNVFYKNGLLSFCFFGEGREIGEYSPLIDVIGTVMMQQPDCAYFKISKSDGYGLCAVWASPAMPSQELKQFLRKILTPGHKMFSFSDRMKEQMVSFLSRKARPLCKEKTIFRISRSQ